MSANLNVGIQLVLNGLAGECERAFERYPALGCRWFPTPRRFEEADVTEGQSNGGSCKEHYQRVFIGWCAICVVPAHQNWILELPAGWDIFVLYVDLHGLVGECECAFEWYPVVRSDWLPMGLNLGEASRRKRRSTTFGDKQNNQWFGCRGIFPPLHQHGVRKLRLGRFWGWGDGNWHMSKVCVVVGR